MDQEKQDRQDIALLQYIEKLGDKIDQLTHSLPLTYVTLLQYDRQSRVHDEKLAEIATRVATIEVWRMSSTQWANDEHNEMKQDWQANMKEVGADLSSLNTGFATIGERLSLLIKVLLWILGTGTTITIAISAAYFSHLIR